MKFNEESTKVDKINAFMQQFAVLQEFEAFGLFFDEEIVKLNNIYSVEEILKAVKETIDLLD
jgi:DNA polymerase III delta subunit